MARIAIVSYDVQTVFGRAGGVAAFTTRWAKLLREAGEKVTIVLTSVDWEPARVDQQWRARYQADDIGLIELQAPPPRADRWPEVPTMRMAEIAAPVLRGFDIVYVQDWGNAAFHLLRERRYSSKPGPVCVTVLHGPSEWELSSNGKYPELPNDLHLSWQERYAARHSDFVVSPSRYMAEYLKSLDWEFPGEVPVLGLPMRPPIDSQENPAHGRIRRIVYFGRVEERKGIRNFVLALQHLAKQGHERLPVILLGNAADRQLLDFAMRGIRGAGFAVTHEGSLDSEGAWGVLREQPGQTLCVIPSPSDNHPYAVVEASLIPGLNVIACRGGGVPEIFQQASAQLCDPLPSDLAAKIAERVHAPLKPAELARYDCEAANEKWLEFHRRALQSQSSQIQRAVPGQKPSVDVCVTYYQKGPFLGQLMDALEQQTETDFHVIAVNDGSPDDESNRVFDEHAAKAAARGWDFYRQANAFVDAARNSAARRGTGDLILFVDADDVPARNAVARMREAITLSGDDALICASYLFASDGRPFDPATGEVLVPPFATCIPLGMDLVGGIVNPAVFGGSMFIVRRSVFEEAGGFRELRGVGHEDWEFYVRLALAGYKVDVLPELLQFYRQSEDSLARTLPSESATRRLLDAYEDALSAAGLKGAALALAGIHKSANEMESDIRKLSLKAKAPRKRFAFFSAAANRFETDPGAIERLRNLYRENVSLEARLKFHKIFLAPFVGPYTPPAP
jgi:O-antigen biosynthesis protein